MKSHRRPDNNDLKNLNIYTSSPAVSSESRFVTIWQQEKSLDISNVSIKQDTIAREINVKCENVLVLKLDLSHLQSGQPYKINCDTDSFKINPGLNQDVFLRNNSDGWKVVDMPDVEEKGPQRSGLFKEAFQNKMLFVYGTNGDKKENDWAYQKARFDAETFWYRGNGAVDVMSDKDFLQNGGKERNVILYGHAGMNMAWGKLIPDSPITVNRGEISFGSESFKGDDLAAFFIFPRLNEDKTSVGVVAGTGMPGMISAIPNRYFVSGAGFPDFMIFRSEMLEKGMDGVVASGFFNHKWELVEDECQIKN